MAGVSLSVNVQDEETQRALELTVRFMRNPRPALLDVGEHMQGSVEERFRQQRDPDGQSWEPLTDFTLANKRNNKILTERGGPGLRGSINYRVTGATLEQGTNKIYGAIHQFGGTIRPRRASALFIGSPRGMTARVQSVTIPQRRYLGVSDSDQQAISEILLRHAMTRE